MQLSAFRDKKIKTSYPEVAELANSESVSVNLTCSQKSGGINLEHICSRKPLETIFTKPLVSAPKRLLKMILRLQRYDLDVRYRKRKELDLADILNLYVPKLTESTGSTSS